MKFLSHVISRGGVAMDPLRIEAMLNLERLKNAYEA